MAVISKLNIHMAIKQYRTEYTGEYVITNTVFKNGQKVQEREWVDNPIVNESMNHRACCIDSGQSTKSFPMPRLEHHRGGLLGRDRMQMYAVEEVWEELKADFHIVLDPARLAEMIEADYQVDNIVYTSTRQCLLNPGEFYLIPHGILYQAAAMAVWLACFDGHKDIYLFGYDVLNAKAEERTKMIDTVRNIMDTFNDVTFYHVTDEHTHDTWLRAINCQTMSVRDFVSYCDI